MLDFEPQLYRLCGIYLSYVSAIGESTHFEDTVMAMARAIYQVICQFSKVLPPTDRITTRVSQSISSMDT